MMSQLGKWFNKKLDKGVDVLLPDVTGHERFHDEEGNDEQAEGQIWNAHKFSCKYHQNVGELGAQPQPSDAAAASYGRQHKPESE